MQVDKVRPDDGPVECLADRVRVIRENAAFDLRLPDHRLVRLSEQRDSLVIAQLLPRVLAIPDGQQPLFGIQVLPHDADDFP